MNSGLFLELNRRKQLAEIIDKLITLHVEQRKSCHVRLKRGVMHDIISQHLGVKISNFMRAFVNSRMVSAGYPLAIQRGNLYYKHAQLKERSHG